MITLSHSYNDILFCPKVPMHYTQSGYTLCSYLAIPKLSVLQFTVHACLFLCLLHISYIVPTEITTYNLTHGIFKRLVI